jgi:RNA methyltransferase, TrmH family
MLTSTRNPKIQWVRTLQAKSRARREAEVFVVEGVRLAEEALAAGVHPQLVLHTEDLQERGRSVIEAFQRDGAAVEIVSPHVMKAASDTETSQGILAVMPIRPIPLPHSPDFILLLDHLKDPGNLGTILRTAAAAGVQAVLLFPGCADPFAPKVVRAAMGAHFHLPIHQHHWEEAAQYLAEVEKGYKVEVYLADSSGGEVYTHVNFTNPAALLVGGEAAGAGDEASRLAKRKVHIPMPGKAESLNAGVAAALLLFEVVRQRNLAGE